ncbi:MAG: S8 family peptidase, partial [Bacteroidia bacterium]|nr:S8 family peptidase [Bacteroidia bacterium]
KTSTTVIVAVIDGGTDAYHPDLMVNMWVNTKEIPGNNIDDDNNGYIDDINGWNFIGGKDGKNVGPDNLELTRLYRLYKPKFDGKAKSQIAAEDMNNYLQYLEVKEEFEAEFNSVNATYKTYMEFLKSFDALKEEMGSDKFSLNDLKDKELKDTNSMLAKNILLRTLPQGLGYSDIYKQIEGGIEQIKDKRDYQLNPEFDPRSIVGDNYANQTEKNYGNNNVKGPDALHGTHVAGIIGAVRDNSYGMNGVANNVRIMVVRVVPDGDERDKDVANGIRYAADNGAKVINMSFGKAYSYNKKIVDDAVAYAESKDVLIIHAAGNDGQNNDKNGNFPNKNFENGTQAKNWVEVGASNPDKSPASFSNYGKKSVDVFAPGTDIYATAPDSTFRWLQGTSMASPVVAGVATLIRSYYPMLTADEVKVIICSSVMKVKGKQPQPLSDVENAKIGEEYKKKSDAAAKKAAKKKSKTESKPAKIKVKTPKIKYKKLCKSGGIVNAEEALELAEKKSKS